MTETLEQMFEMPTPELVEHALRELSYEERLLGYKMTPSAGNAPTNMYSLRDAVIFLTGTPWDAPMLHEGFKGTLNWVDGTKLVPWLRDVIGDDALATAVELQALPLETYMAQNLKIAELVEARMLQYRDVRTAAAESEE